MKRLSLFVILFVLSCSTSSANIFLSLTIQQAEQFFSLIDNHDYQTAYKTSSDLFRVSSLEKEWIVERRCSEKFIGVVLERKLGFYPELRQETLIQVYPIVNTSLCITKLRQC